MPSGQVFLRRYSRCAIGVEDESAADLLAQPEHQTDGAYDVLAGAEAADDKDAIYPFNLPFNLPLEESRVYLSHLGVSRARLMEAFLSRDIARTDVAVASEALGLSPLEWDVIADNTLNPTRQPEDFWGLSGDPSWADKLTHVTFLLSQASPDREEGMPYATLTDLLRTDFVQSPSSVGVWFPSQTCDTSKAILIGLTDATLSRLHRFVRLQRRVGWSNAELDRAIDMLGGGRLDHELLIELSHVRRLQAELRVPIAELLTWWGPLDTRRWESRMRRGIPEEVPNDEKEEGVGWVFNNQLTDPPADPEVQSPYDRLFHSRSLSSPPKPAFEITSLLGGTELLTNHVADVAGGLGASSDDVHRLLGRLADQSLTLANLSSLYRHLSLARALSLDVASFVSRLDLIGLDPFDAAHTEDTLAFVDEVGAVRDSGFTVEELDYLLRYTDSSVAALEPDTNALGILLLQLADALRKVEVDLPLPDAALSTTELRETLTLRLAMVLAPADVQTGLDVVDVKKGTAPPANTGQVIGLCNNFSVECSGLIDAGHRLFPRWIDATQTITKETKR